MHELLNLAKSVSWDNIFSVLKEKPDIVNLRPESRDFGLIHFAVFNLRHEQAERLLTEFKADIHAKTRDGRTPLSLIEESISKQPLDIPALSRKKNEELLRFVQELDRGVANPVPPRVAALTKSGSLHTSPAHSSSGGGARDTSGKSTHSTRHPADGGPKKAGGQRVEVILVPVDCGALGGEYVELVAQINRRPVYRQNSSSRHFMYYLDDAKFGWVIHSSLDDECQMPLAYLGAVDSKLLDKHPCDKRFGVYWTVLKRVAVAGKAYAVDRSMGVQRSFSYL